MVTKTVRTVSTWVLMVETSKAVQRSATVGAAKDMPKRPKNAENMDAVNNWERVTSFFMTILLKKIKLTKNFNKQPQTHKDYQYRDNARRRRVNVSSDTIKHI